MEPPVLTETAYAKLNLALHVRARRADGYHELESLFAFCADGDGLSGTLREDGEIALRIEGPFADGLPTDDRNLVMRAAQALQTATGGHLGADLLLEKRLPVASGIGGGSADAAAALRLLVRLWDVRPMEIDFPAIASALGADVPACLGSATVFGSGVGDRLETIDLDLAETPVLLVNPLIACPTGPVFGGWDGIDRGALDPLAWARGRNDLTASAMALVPEIEEVLAVLRAQLPQVARMSGSGATCFAVFASEVERDAAADRIIVDHPDWWVMTSLLR
ncbi:4-(cytidine 5'-diphospho)-2-C-methyl-D-erythritol kinase [Sphingobium sp. B11D3B]|uniref:4-(cytidine 5'-diphospho)-2-C-methyl-D-erythritol kinase n=1 Tax=Sphingobium sp. B11D3B TaxID=2940575 RepID=UPI002225D6F5|nr:4-(cytidine 5'-diphospho)-2-C-methyl-D-erythritol kinase [Sphingobium sp. B11D3B]